MPITELLSRFNVFPGQSAAVNGANLVTAVNTARSDGLSLCCEEGLYLIDRTIELAYFESCLLALGPKVTFQHTGSGRFFSYNGSAYNPSGGVNKCVFGGAYPIQLRGNPGQTTDLMYVNQFVDGRLRMRGRDAAVALRLDGVGSIGPGGVPSNVGCELSKFEVIVSPTSDQSAFAYSPAYGICATNAYVSEFYIDLESCGTGGNPAAYFDQSVRNRISGALQSNQAGGFYTTSTCAFNEAQLHCEDNGSDADFIIHGSHETLRNCASASPTRMKVYGDYNTIEQSNVWGAQVLSGTKNRFTFNNSMATNGGFTDAGTGTVVYDCDGVANKNWP